MAIREVFTDEEWALVDIAPLKVVMCASKASRGFIAMLRELDVYPAAIIMAKKKYRNNELVMSIIDDEEMADREEALQRESDTTGRNDEAFVARLIREVMEAVEIVREKAAGDLQGYKEMLCDLALAIVSASGEGLFGTGKRISTEEKAFIEKLRSDLSL